LSSILIPAHNEASVVGATLTTLLEGLDPGIEVLVACNGCRDATAEVARGFGDRVRVLEIEQASKTAALNAATEVAGKGAHVVLDADIQFPGIDASRLVDALEAEGALAVEPVPRMNLDHSSFGVRGYYAVWLALHGDKPGKIGGGVLGLSAAARARLGTFPDIIADDGWVRAHFETSELVYLTDCTSVVEAPRTVGDLIRIKTRSRLGNKQLRQRFPDLRGASVDTGGWGSKLRRLSPRLWVHVPTYVWVTVRAERRARAQARDLASYVWERDESSR
tara:strand:+ start:1680 stop:2513 length:834 start_codon:yes stop_codon:yes gene_type:complete